MTPYAGVDTTRLLVEAMRVAQINHRVIANNIANVDTPHFNPTRLNFQGTLRSIIEGREIVPLRRTDSRHLDTRKQRPQFERLAFLSKNDYNKVDVDEEMVRLSENTGKYTTYGSLLAKQFDMVKKMLTNLR